MGRIRTRISLIDAMMIQAAIAAALSFSHIHDIAVMCGQGDTRAWAYPISVDLLLFAAWRRIRAGRGGRMEWFWFAVAFAASLGANLATAGGTDSVPPAALTYIVSGWPALAFLGGTLLVHSGQPAEPTAEPEDEAAPEAAEATPETDEVQPKAIMTVSEASEATGVPASTIRGWRRDGQITDHGMQGRAALVDLVECQRLALAR